MKKQDILPFLLSKILPENISFPEVPLGDYKVVGLGKAAPSHVKAFFDKLGERDHLIITKDGVPDLGLNCLYGSHPNYSEKSIENGEKLISWIEEDQRDILFVISGGASSVVEKLKPENSLNQVQSQIDEYLKGQASIHTINEYRKSISLLKGGGLKHIFKDRNIHTWLVKDVPGSDVSDVGSGPTLENGDLNYKVLSSYEDLESDVKNIEYEFISPALDCSLEEGMKILLKRGRSISGGELTVDVKANGRGGRNSHFVLAAGIELFENNILSLSEREMEKVFISSLATDGDDGNSNSAGAFLDFPSWKVAKSLGLEPIEYLQNSDSASFFERLGCVYLTGITGTNVMDLRLVFIP